MIVGLADADVAAAGGKASVLARLLAAGLAVPDGFVVTAGPVPVRELDRAYRRLGADAVAVRSSAAAEDGAVASFAGQHDTVLGAVGAQQVAEAVEDCRRSLRSDRSVAYREAVAGGAGADGQMAVLVQRLVDADVGGVASTVDPLDGSSAAVVEASWGLGTSVVAGTVDPDRYRVEGDRVVDGRTGTKAVRVDRSPAGGTVTTAVDAHDRGRRCLPDHQVLAVVRLARAVATVLGRPAEVEWAWSGDRLWLLQGRPVTALPIAVADVRRPTDAGAPSVRGETVSHGTVLQGTPGSRGSARGRAAVLDHPGAAGGMRPGDVLVCRETDPAWTPLLLAASAVVTETGGVLSHAAIVARERGIPAVLGVRGAAAALAAAPEVVVDGDRGTVAVQPS